MVVQLWTLLTSDVTAVASALAGHIPVSAGSTNRSSNNKLPLDWLMPIVTAAWHSSRQRTLQAQMLQTDAEFAEVRASLWLLL